jgi:quercetin dioxygenase-like cupin family protein
MYLVDEKDKNYRFGDSGPKYLMKGPRLNFAIVRFNPGQSFTAHYHNYMEEDFYIIQGKIDIYVDNSKNTLSKGQFIHIDPGEVHYVANNYSEPVVMVSTLGPHQSVDKIEVKDYLEKFNERL